MNPSEQKLRTYKKKVKNKKGEMVEYVYKKNYPDIKYICECGGKYSRTNKSHHNKSKKHKRYEESIKQDVYNFIESSIKESRSDDDKNGVFKVDI